MAKTAAPTDGSSGKARRRGAAGRAGGRRAASSSPQLACAPARPPSLPPSPLAAPARPPAPRSPFHLKIFKTLHINICALHNLTRALLIARSLMQPARPIAESSPGGSRAGAARSAPRSGCRPRWRPRSSRLPRGARRRGFAPWLGIFIIWGRGGVGLRSVAAREAKERCAWWGGRDGRNKPGEEKGQRKRGEGPEGRGRKRRGAAAAGSARSRRLRTELKGRRSERRQERKERGERSRE